MWVFVPAAMVDEWRPARSASDENWADTAARLDLPSRETCLQLLAGIRYADVDVVALLNSRVDLETFVSWVETRRDQGELDVRCPNRHESAVIIKNGHRERGQQRYHCRRCQASFSVLTGTIFYRRQLSIPMMVYLVSHMEYSPLVRLAEYLPVEYRSVIAFVGSARKATDQDVVDVIRQLSIGTPPDELSS